MRTPADYELLSRHADSIAVFELQGDLFFGSTERLFRTVVDDLAGVDAVVLDCKRIGNLDGAAISMLSNLRTALNDVGCVLVVADAPADVLADISSHSFSDTDGALEWCEDRILEPVRRASGVDPRGPRHPGAARRPHARGARAGGSRSPS